MTKSGTSHIARALRGEGSDGKPSLARGFRLGTWLARPDLCVLESGEQRVQLEPKIMGVLLCLAEHAPQVVTREQFIAAVWDGRVVSDEVLSRAISLLRSALQDDPQDPRYVRTVPRVGYALIAPIDPLEPPEAPPVAQPPARRPGWRVWIFATAGLAAVAILLAWWSRTRDGEAVSVRPVRLAVLPLASPGGEPDTGLADGLTEELTISLARIPGLRVVARNSALRYRSDAADLSEVAEALGATHALAGSLRTTGDRLRINVHLADSASDTEVWAESFDRGLDDLFAVQADITAAVARNLSEQLRDTSGSGSRKSEAIEAPPASPEAYRLYLLGRRQLARRGEEGLVSAIGFLDQAIEADPTFLRARFALAWAHTLLANASPAHAEAAAVAVDRELAAVARETAMSGEIDAVRAWLELERNRWVEAEAAFRAALAAAPDETEFRLLYSQMRGALGDRDTASSEAHTALMNDPLSPAATLRVAVLRLWADDEAEAASQFAKARELGLAPSASPEVSMLLLARHRELGQLEAALRTVQRRRSQSEDWITPAIAAIENPARGAAAEAAMESAAAAGQIDSVLHFGALVLAGRDDRALRWLLERSRLRTRELEFTFLSREAAGLRRLPGFGQVVTQFGLDAHWDRFGWPAACARSMDTVLCR